MSGYQRECVLPCCEPEAPVSQTNTYLNRLHTSHHPAEQQVRISTVGLLVESVCLWLFEDLHPGHLNIRLTINY